jgi:hypothetical protein
MFKRLKFLIYTVCILLVFGNNANPDIAKKASIDSLLIIAAQCLNSADYECARSRYVQAHLSGMSRDSLCYFMSDLYLKKGFYDTAFVYNFACKSTNPDLLSRCTIQRKIIIDTLTNRRKSNNAITPIPDSSGSIKNLPDQSTKKRAFNYISAFIAPAYFSYESSDYYTMGDLLLPDIIELKKPYTSIGFSDRFIYKSKSRRIRATQQFSISEQLSIVPAAFSSSILKIHLTSLEHDDLLLDGISALFSSTIEDLKKGTRFTNSATISSNMKDSKYFNLFSSLNYPVKIENAQYYIGFTSRCLIDKNNSVADSKFGINLTGTGGPKNIFQYGPLIDLSYNWRPAIELFSMKIGYTDSLVFNKKYSYYYDKECQNPSEYKTLVRKYWANLPSKPWVYMPQQNISSTVGLNGLAFLKKNLSMFGMTSMTGQIYTQHTVWHTTRYIPDLFDEADYETFYLLYEKKSGHYFSNIRSESSSYVGGFKQASLPEEFNFRRLDASFFALLKLQYTGKRFNNVSISGWYGKTFSNVSNKPLPTPIPDYKWGFQIEYNPTLFCF